MELSFHCIQIPTLKMQTIIRILTLPILLLSSLIGKDSTILFLGSSSTYYHQMPDQVAKWAEGTGAYGKVRLHWVGEAGTWTWKYLKPGFRPKNGLPEDFSGNVLDFIQQRNFRWISLQVALGQWDAWERTIPRYADAAKKAESQLLLYEQSWNPKTEKALDGSPILKIARELDLTIVPCASAWEKVYSDYPQWDLQDSYFNVKKGVAERDSTHPGLVGNYLNQACFVAAITGAHPNASMRNSYYHHERMAHPRSKPYLPAGIKVSGAPSDGVVQVSIEPNLGGYLRQIAWETFTEVENLKNSTR